MSRTKARREYEECTAVVQKVLALLAPCSCRYLEMKEATEVGHMPTASTDSGLVLTLHHPKALQPLLLHKQASR